MIRKFLCISALAAGGASGAAAITLETVTWRGHSVWQATGPIERGDVEHFRSALANTPSLPHGLPVVLLDSPGGDVKEALAIAGLLEQYPAHMVIPEGAECASACASIIFIAGELRTVEPGGLLGQHSCSSDGEPNDFCNEAIARHALARGVPYGSVEAFTKYVPPSEILWFRRRDADCWGLSRYPFTSESGYVTTADCALEMITGVMPPAQVAWRVDFLEDGYRAFLRPYSDDARDGELSLYCDETRPGLLFLSMDIGGPSQVISGAILSATLDARPVRLEGAEYVVEQVDAVYSRLIVEIPEGEVQRLLTEADSLTLRFELHAPYDPIWADTVLESSRAALQFAADNCINGQVDRDMVEF